MGARMSLKVKLPTSFGAVTVAMILLGALIYELRAMSAATAVLYEEDHLPAAVAGGAHDRSDPPSRTGGTSAPVAAPAGAGA